MATFLESLKRSVAAVTIDIDEAEAGKAALEARIRTLKQERQRLEAKLTRELAAAAGKTPPIDIIMQTSSTPSSSTPSSLDHRGSYASPPLVEPRPWDAGQTASSAADVTVTASRKRKRKAPATTAAQIDTTATANPYACSMCPKRFCQKGAIPQHERTHTGEKPYACSMCPAGFTVKSAVVQHERTRTGEKP